MRSVQCQKCGNDTWDTYIHRIRNVAKCENCGFQRAFFTRKPRADYITPSQKVKIEAIRSYFDGSDFSLDGKPKRELHSFDVKLAADGVVSVTVETNSHPITMEGGVFWVGRKGGLRVIVSYSLYDNKKHIAHMLGGKVG